MTGEVMGGLLCSPTRINSYSGRTKVLLHLSAYCGGDRAIVGIALLTIIMLAWLYVGRLATSVETVGINMTGTRMVSTGTRMVTISILQPWSAAEFVFMFLIHDGRNDAAVSHPDGSALCMDWPCDCLRYQPHRPDRVVCSRLAAHMVRICVAATNAQWALERAALLTPMVSTSNFVGDILLIGPLKA
jgi:hypothetical protein